MQNTGNQIGHEWSLKKLNFDCSYTNTRFGTHFTWYSNSFHLLPVQRRPQKASNQHKHNGNETSPSIKRLNPHILLPEGKSISSNLTGAFFTLVLLRKLTTFTISARNPVLSARAAVCPTIS